MSERAGKTIITRWLLDTRALWPGDKIKNSATKYLDLLPLTEQEPAVRKYHPADARMSLGSALLKRAYLAEATGLSWSEIKLSRKLDLKLGKPCWIAPKEGGPWPSVDFNMSHQRGIVLLVGAATYPSTSGLNRPELEISVDLVSPNERNDMSAISSSDLTQFIAPFDSVFSDDEIFNITYSLPPNGTITLLSGETIPNSALGRHDRITTCGKQLSIHLPDGRKETIESDMIVEEKLRRFYTAFALKEAILKLGGEGLSAEWVRDCEFHNVRAPKRGGVPRCNLSGVWGERILGGKDDDSLGVSLKGKPIEDVQIELQAFEEDYMFATMLRPAGSVGDWQGFPEWKRIDLASDIWEVASR